MKFKIKTLEELRLFKENLSKDYAELLNSNLKIPIKQANILAKKEIDEIFNSLHEKHRVYNVLFKNNIIGEIWLSLNEKNKSCFIYDVKINENERHKGYGEKIMQSLYVFLSENSIESIELTIYGDNKSYIDFYKKNGFEISSVRMTKNLK
ncbi:GNAT family N-acetyltransferase [Oceanotoga teriensis]|uniref:Acetyltransferase (GNAT) family protein n=1 Tax=Oceanotoga teriensis TaxID=515440 RepID=A0AA45HIG6_9BACT|nr:GNAT family N-acetyltransferase [Oceanotoga teriensis]MDO7977081.1 GNAT family N-acetyltransferase [Oceanotoga teriensis]PWJ92198.1 acetyltransferase (GNAT) family protein [Oceanotoga teriensis]